MSSGWAILVYAAIILVLVIGLIVAFMISDSKGGKTDKKNDVAHSVEAIKDGRGSSGEKGKKDATEEGNRFPTLTGIDAESRKYMRDDYDDNITLKEMCESFRNFAAYKQKLYYDIQDIRRFIAGLSVSHIMILQGMSGTGKTSLAYAFGEYLENPSTVIPDTADVERNARTCWDITTSSRNGLTKRCCCK